MKTYKTNRLPALAVTAVCLAIIFSVGIDRLMAFYKDWAGIVLVSCFALVCPLFVFFGFAVGLSRSEITYRHHFFLRKKFNIGNISHVLYQPTWRGLMGLNSSTNMRSLHIVRNSGGWRDTISLANGAFREDDLADIARELRQANPRVVVDEHVGALIKKYQ